MSPESGAIDGLDEDQPVTITIDSADTDNLASAKSYPDADGKVTLAADVTAPAGSTEATATVTYADGEGGAAGERGSAGHPWEFTVTYPQVPTPAVPAAGGGQSAATPAAVALLADYLTRHAGHVPTSIAQGLKSLDVAAWVKDQQERLSHGQLNAKQKDILAKVRNWLQSGRQAARFKKGVGALFVWANQHEAMPGSAAKAGNFALGEWAARQRDLYAQRALNAKQVALLEAVPGWTWEKPA